MPLVTIWRDAKKVPDRKATQLRDLMLEAVVETLGVELNEVEVRVQDIGRLGVNSPPVGIELDTGPGKDRCRVREKIFIAKSIAGTIAKAEILPLHWLSPTNGPYIWLRICESAFVPIGFPEHAR